MSMVGNKGDTIRIPKPDRGDASIKAEETQVTLISGVTGELVIAIDQHYEYSRLIEDITDVQAKNSLRRFYTEDAGYALATRVDTALIAEAANFDNQVEFNGGAWALLVVLLTQPSLTPASVQLSSCWMTPTSRWTSVAG